MKDIEITESKFFGLFKKTYKTKVSNRKYEDILKKYIRVEDTIAHIMNVMPLFVVAGITSSIASRLRRKKEGFNG